MSEEKDTAHKSRWRERFRRASGSDKMTPRRRRQLLWGGAAVLAIVVFVLVPAHIATQPSFMRRYSHFSAEYNSWATSVHAEVPCQRCHVAPNPIAQAGYGVRMLGEFYLSTVNPSRQPALFPPPTNAACQSCHSGLRAVSPSGDLNIPHRAHVVVLKLPCIKCHAYLVHTTNPVGKHTPSMATCLTCHDGVKAKNDCSTCHANKGEPVSHRSPNWIVVHAQMQDKIDCKSCHAWTPNWCAECHAKRPKSHAADWRARHGRQVALHRNCEACHEAAFCARCHGSVPN